MVVYILEILNSKNPNEGGFKIHNIAYPELRGAKIAAEAIIKERYNYEGKWEDDGANFIVQIDNVWHDFVFIQQLDVELNPIKEG